jgi:hypothetical protein
VVLWFPVQWSCGFPHKSVKKSPERDGQNACSGSDDNEDAPIGCTVKKDDSENMGVIRQLKDSLSYRGD